MRAQLQVLQRLISCFCFTFKNLIQYHIYGRFSIYASERLSFTIFNPLTIIIIGIATHSLSSKNIYSMDFLYMDEDLGPLKIGPCYIQGIRYRQKIACIVQLV